MTLCARKGGTQVLKRHPHGTRETHKIAACTRMPCMLAWRSSRSYRVGGAATGGALGKSASSATSSRGERRGDEGTGSQEGAARPHIWG
eukprot:1522704-Pleurochrysis_carterae.AAC.1